MKINNVNLGKGNRTVDLSDLTNLSSREKNQFFWGLLVASALLGCVTVFVAAVFSIPTSDNYDLHPYWSRWSWCLWLIGLAVVKGIFQFWMRVIIIGVSRDSVRSHDNFKAKLELPFTLVSDPDETLCTLFGVMKMKKMYGKEVRGIERSTFVIDAEGVLRREWRGVKVPGHVDEILEAVQAL